MANYHIRHARILTAMPAVRDPDPPLDALSRFLRTSSSTVLARVADAWDEIGTPWQVSTFTPEVLGLLDFLGHFAGRDQRGVHDAVLSRTATLSAAQGEALRAYVTAFDDIAFGYQQGIFPAGVEAMPDPWPAGASSPHGSPDEPPP
jgi:hypothetical protein